MKKYNILIIAGFFYSWCFSQQPGDITFPAPDVASLLKFIEKPVSPYNGQADVSIPIYVLNEDKISIPIVLRYNTSGNKVAEESGRVGLGWNLDIGGSIIREVVTEEDIPEHLYDAYNNPEEHFCYVENECSSLLPSTSFSACTSDPLNDVTTCDRFTRGCHTGDQVDPIQLHKQDLQPDKFYYKFGNYSGEFYIDYRDEEFSIHQVIENPKVKFELDDIYSPEQIIAKTMDGYVYYFGGVKSYTTKHPLPPWCPFISFTYYLDYVVLPNGQKLEYNYDFTGEGAKPNWSMSQVYQTNIPSEFTPLCSIKESIDDRVHTYYSSSVYDVCLLDDIQAGNSIINFYYSYREDLLDERKIDSIKVYELNNSIPVKTIKFYYSYFISVRETDEPYDHMVTTATSYKRLKLDSVQIDNIPSYKFTYNPTSLPIKSSYATDYWGYYNGMRTNTSHLPNLYYYYLLDKEVHLIPDDEDRRFFGIGCCKASSEAASKACILEKITYPTGGETQIIYEANTFNNYKIATRDELYNLALLGDIEPTITIKDKNCARDYINFPEDITSYNFTLDNETYVIIKGTINCGLPEFSQAELYEANILMTKTSGEQSTVIDWEYSGQGNKNFTFRSFLEAGDYSIQVVFPDDLGLQFDTTYYETTPSNRNAYAQAHIYIRDVNINYSVSKGAGLRVKEIIQNPDNYDTPVFTKYEYSGGLLMSPLNFLEKKDAFATIEDGIIFCRGRRLTLYNDSYIPLSFNAAGALVGYTNVKEYIDDESASYPSGYVKYTFHNEVSQVYPLFSVPNIKSKLNGREISTSIIDKKGNTIEKTDYNYATNRLNCFFAMKLQEHYFGIEEIWIVGDPVSATTIAHPGRFDNRFTLIFYPISSDQLLLTSKEVTKLGSITQSYNYDYNANGLLVKTKTYNSKGDSLEDRITYIDDPSVTDPVMEIMKNNDINGMPALKYKYVNDNLTKKEKYSYLQTGTVQVQGVNSTYSVPVFNVNNYTLYPTGSNDSLTIDYHYQNNKIVQSSPSNKYKTSYIWGYNKTYPVAKVENAAHDQILYESFETNSSISNTDSKTGRYSLEYHYWVIPPGPGDYILTYWKKSPGQNWQFVKENISGNSLIGDTDGTLIDEVRVYPEGALMTTYTYDPLVGITSVTDPKDHTTRYEYDTSNRLKTIRDFEGNLLKSYEYHYVNE